LNNDWSALSGAQPVTSRLAPDDGEITGRALVTVGGDSGDLSRPAGTARPNDGAGATADVKTAIPIAKNDRFIPYTIDREEFFELSRNVSPEWIHRTYMQSKNFRYFLGAMMQILNAYGEDIFLLENGLRLSTSVLLKRIGSAEEMKRRRLEKLSVEDDLDLEDSEFEDDGDDVESDEDECEGGGSRKYGKPSDTSSHSAASNSTAASSSSSSAAAAAATAASAAAAATNRLNLSQLLGTNLSATKVAKFFNGIVNSSLIDEEMAVKHRAYFQRMKAFQDVQETEVDESGSRSGHGDATEDAAGMKRTKEDYGNSTGAKSRKRSKSTGGGTSAANAAHVWCEYLHKDYRKNKSKSRPLHQELLLMDNLKDLLFDMFHEPQFYAWIVKVVNEQKLATNNLLDFSERCLNVIFSGYVYTLRVIEKKLNRKEMNLVVVRDAAGYMIAESTSAASANANSNSGNSNTTTTAAQTIADGSGPAVNEPSTPRTLSEHFWRYGKQELDNLRDLWPCRYVSSPNLFNVATGLREYIEFRHETGQLPRIRPKVITTKLDNMCYFLICLYTFSDCNIAYMLFMLRLLVSIKYPGPWNKSIQLIQGSSNSGKSELIEVVRSFYNSSSGVLNPTVWRTAANDDIGTNLFPLMENLICQSDEVESMSNTLLKTVISKTSKQCRSFKSQVSQQLHNLAKVFLSVNKMPKLDSDDGTLTRLRLMLPTFHRYLPRVQKETDTTKIQDVAAMNVALQILTRQYPIKMEESLFKSGFYYYLHHFAVYAVNKGEHAFAVSDLVHSMHSIRLLRNEPPLTLSSSIDPRQLNVNNPTLMAECVFLACTTNIDGLSETDLLRMDERCSQDPDVFFTHQFAEVVDRYDTKTHVNLTNQPTIALLFRFDLHASLDPIVKFGALYRVRATNTPIDWSCIERVLREFLIEFYASEDRGDSCTATNVSSGTSNSGALKKEVDDEAISATVSLHNPNALSRRISFKPFYDRFKNKYANMQYKDPQTGQIVQNKWCMSIVRKK
jgi:hypothetical protein